MCGGERGEGRRMESMRWEKGRHYKRRDEKKDHRWIDRKTRLLGRRRKGGSRSHALCYYGDRNG